MEEETKKSLKNLSLTAYRGGLVPTFLGVGVVFVGLVKQDINQMFVGICIFIAGYVFIKMAKRISDIVTSEKGPQ